MYCHAVLRKLTRPWIAVTAGLTATALALLVLLPPAASGHLVVPKPRGVTSRSGSNTQMTLTSTGAGHSVDGFIANADNPFDSATQPYPTTNPVSGFTPKNESFAGIINGTPTGGGSNLELYCIDILTSTYIGFGYELGTWDSANVPNVGFVARILNEYYPNTNEPSSLTSAADKAAAVQAAIWYFSDRYVLSTSDPLHAAVAAIVTKVQSEGPLIQPPPPTLAITPTNASGPAGSVVGPFTVTSSLADATVSAVGATMYANAAATVPIANGTKVPSGTQIWLKSTGPSSAVLRATAEATVPTGNVYLYDGDSSPSDAQKLILAHTTTLTTTVSATAEFKAPGSLVVNKTITGPAAGLQGRVVIHTVCDQTPLTPNLVIQPGAPAGTYSHTYTDIPAGSLCTITATEDGHTRTITVIVHGDGEQMTVPAGGIVTAHLTDSYDHAPGSLRIYKLIDGPAAGHQGEVVIHTVCDGHALHPDFVIHAGSPAGVYSHTYTDIPAGSHCIVTVIADGHTSTVTVVVHGNHHHVTIPAGHTAIAALADHYDFAPGSLVVHKTIGGPAAGSQDTIVIDVSCTLNGATSFTGTFTITAHSAAGTYSRTFDSIPAGSACTVEETVDGSTGTVTVAVTGSGQQVTVPAGGTATASLTDTYDNVPGSLVVNKAILGPAAGSQDTIVIDVSCTLNGATSFTGTFTITAHSPAGTYSRTFDSIPAGSACTVTEPTNGINSTVTVTTTGDGQVATIPAAGGATASLMNTYDFVPGMLEVTKAITGPAAGHQGEVTVHTVCDGTALSPDLVIPADSPATSYSHTYADVPGNSACTVSETADGSTSTVSVTVTGDGQTVTVPAGGSMTASLADSYDFVPGALVVAKTISGPAAGHQRAVTVSVSCNLAGATSFSGKVVIPAGSPAGTSTRSLTGIPAGSDCTVTETNDGSTATVMATVTGNPQKVSVGAGEVVPVGITDVYSYAPGALTVTKTIHGPSAGKQGRIAILVACGEPAQVFAFIIPAGTRAGSVKRSFTGIAAGSRCTITEVLSGATSSVSVVVGGSGQSVTVPAAGAPTVRVTDRFSPIVPVTG
jgi:Domain of unknown function (DUF5979)/Thioester domain